MPILTSDFNSLTDDLQSIFDETVESRVASDVGMSLFDVKDEVRKTHEHIILHGTDGPSKVAEGADLPEASTEEGDSIIYTQSRYGKILTIAKDDRLFDLYDKIEGRAQGLFDSAFDYIDQSFSDLLLNGWATSHTDVYGATVTDTLTPGGLSLFSASHTTPLSADTFSNIINDGTNNNPTFSRTAVTAARSTARKYTDPNGLHRPILLDTIIVPPDLEDLAYRTIKSEKISGSGNNDENPEFIRSMKIVVWDRLAATSSGTDTSAYWFMVDSKKVKETFKARFAQRPMLSPPDEVYESKNWKYSLDYYYSRGVGYPAYAFGSKGTNS